LAQAAAGMMICQKALVVTSRLWLATLMDVGVVVAFSWLLVQDAAPAQEAMLRCKAVQVLAWAVQFLSLAVQVRAQTIAGL
jgi:hypothetical protein